MITNNNFFLNILNNTKKDLISKFGKNNTDYILNILGTGTSFLETICLLPTWFNTSFNTRKNITTQKIITISQANLNAWIGYTLYDYLRDGKIPKNKFVTILSIANICTQEALKMFILNTKSKIDLEYISKLFNTIDLFYIKQEDKKYSQLPISTNFKKLCSEINEKSIAASITALLVTPTNLKNEHNYKNILYFFKHYFTARQLSDDLDDVKKDIKLKLLTPATILVYKGYSQQNMKLLIRNEIDKNILQAKKYIAKIPSFNSKIFIEHYVKPC